LHTVMHNITPAALLSHVFCQLGDLNLLLF